MPRVDLSPSDPDDPHNLDPEDQRRLLPPSTLERHPYVRRLRREIDRLKETVRVMADTQREMMNRSLVVGRHLEPLNPAPLGPLVPANNEPTIVHVDNLRMLANRVRGEDAPTIRILVGGLDAAPLHAHWVQLGASELRERPMALPGRSGAFVVLHTSEPVIVKR